MTAVRGVIAALIITSLVIAAFLLLTRSDSDHPLAVSSTTAVADTTNSVVSTTAAASTTTAAPATTTLEQREQEVAEILQALWFGWFDAIYRKDTDALWDVVATEEMHDAGEEAMIQLHFVASPTEQSVDVTILEILLDRADCLVVYHTSDASGILERADVTGVEVLWPSDRGMWRLATSWIRPNDLWENDCDLRER